MASTVAPGIAGGEAVTLAVPDGNARGAEDSAGAAPVGDVVVTAVIG
ncbi:MAG: hypothetical protein M3159_01780 [Actinomycetota bacterium]|nr:hypothetical protein [Actinomycetota bacterium]